MARSSLSVAHNPQLDISSISTVIVDFPFQSFFDNTQQLEAVRVQSPSQLLISAREVPVSGYGLGLHPDSQTPIAVRFKTNQGMSDTPVYILTPGQIIWPHEVQFSGFVWGTPFGWLGGGVAQAVVFKSPVAKVVWPQVKTEVPLQRFRVQIQGGGDPAFQFGLPLRFPSPNTLRYNPADPSTPFNQGGVPQIAVEPTRTTLTLRAAMSGDVVWVVENPQNLYDGVNPILVESPVTFPAAVASFPTVELYSPGVLYAGDAAQLTVLDDTDTDALAGQFIDVVRYGRI